MEDIDFKIPMTRDKLVELGQQVPTTYRLVAFAVSAQCYFIVSSYCTAVMEVTLTLRELTAGVKSDIV